MDEWALGVIARASDVRKVVTAADVEEMRAKCEAIAQDVAGDFGGEVGEILQEIVRRIAALSVMRS